MDLGLKRKVAIVAASSKGMGKATAMGLAAEGARVTMLARNGTALMQAAEEIRQKYQADVLAIPADVTRHDDIKRVVQGAVARWDTLNLLSTIRFVRAVLPHMRRAGGGAIINLQSTSVKVPIDNLILSNAIRPGVIGLAKSLSVELAKDKIRVNNVLPGAIMTDRLRQVMTARAQAAGKTFEEIQRSREAEIPLGWIGDPEDVANTIVFLASNRARYVTGVTVQVDGGLIRSLL